MLSGIRILLIEDNRILREGITAMINEQEDVQVAAVSDGKDNPLLKTRSVKPHVVLMDLGLDSQNSLDMVQSVKKEQQAGRLPSGEQTSSRVFPGF